MTPPVRVLLRLAVPDDDLAARALPLLDPQEREREARFQHAGARQEFLVGRWLVRTSLGQLLDRDPRELRFVANQWGAPRLAPDTIGEPWRFNLSHTRGLVALALAEDVAVGVDVEDTQRTSRTVEIADRFFAPEEVAELRGLAPSAQRDRFFDYWTLKESYIKARGMGLAIPLGKFAFAFDREGISLSVAPELGDDPARWRFWRFDPTPRHRLALAAACGQREAAVDTSWRVGLASPA